MSTTYKGFTIPEIMPDGKLYHIISAEGVFDGYSELAVLSHWKNKVDTLYTLDAIDSGYKEISEGVLGCPDCGSVVWDVYAHRNFHQDLTN